MRPILIRILYFPPLTIAQLIVKYTIIIFIVVMGSNFLYTKTIWNHNETTENFVVENIVSPHKLLQKEVFSMRSAMTIFSG